MAPKTRLNRNSQQHNGKLASDDESSEEENATNANLTLIIDNLNEQFKLQSKAMRKIKESQQHISDTFDDLRKEIDRLVEENKTIKKELKELKTSGENVKTKMRKLERDLLTVKQKQNTNNIIITNMPKIPNTDLKEAVIKIAAQVKANITKDNIIDVYQNENKKFKTYPIIVKMNNQELITKCIDFRKRNEIIDFNKIAPNLNINMRGKNINVYQLMEKEFSSVFKKVKQEAKAKGYKYVWIKDAKVLVRKDDNSATILVEEMEDLKKLQ
ncbi:uncharacterized protein LOC118736121 [Rhagoletis pomonella]|uniref:uncharacterized protein LOC118736121 n=1 Tax=Rhagoletis pomonella TaxID=28610 RepID=UPI00177BE018|nr:uncharacterized protein LOC118736121 [Rhagoletis pomonella]